MGKNYFAELPEKNVGSLKSSVHVKNSRKDSHSLEPQYEKGKENLSKNLAKDKKFLDDYKNFKERSVKSSYRSARNDFSTNNKQRSNSS